MFKSCFEIYFKERERDNIERCDEFDYFSKRVDLSFFVLSILWWIGYSIVIRGYVVQKIVDVAEYCVLGVLLKKQRFILAKIWH